MHQSKLIVPTRNALAKLEKKGMVFWYQNCSDLLWEKNCFSDREKLLKFEAKFAKFLRSLDKFVQTVKGQKNFW